MGYEQIPDTDVFDKPKKKAKTSYEYRTSRYHEYLKTQEWKDKRELVLMRDNYKCQSCLVRTAEEIHHLTYEHCYNEPLYELVSLCVVCHQHITELDGRIK